MYRSRSAVVIMLGLALGCREPPSEKARQRAAQSGASGTPAPVGPLDPAAIALKVGAHEFSGKDIQTAARILMARYPESRSTDLGAYTRLIEASLQADVLATMDAPINEEDITAEAKRIDGATRLPEVLKQIKRIAGTEPDYRRLYVLPTLAARRFHFEVYPGYAPAHETTRQAAEGLRDAARTAPGGLKTAAAKLPRARFERGTLGTDGFLPDRADPASRPDRPGLDREPMRPRRFGDDSQVKGLLGEANTAEVNPVLVEDTGSFVLIRATGWDEGPPRRRRVEVVTVPKRPSDEFFWKRASQISVRVADAAVAARLRQEVSWMSRVHLVD